MPDKLKIVIIYLNIVDVDSPRCGPMKLREFFALFCTTSLFFLSTNQYHVKDILIYGKGDIFYKTSEFLFLTGLCVLFSKMKNIARIRRQ